MNKFNRAAHPTRPRRVAAGVALVAALVVTAAAPTVDAQASRRASNTDRKLEQRVRVRNIETHLDAFAAIAAANGGTRAASTDGFDISTLYVVDQLKRAGYTPEVSEFEYNSYEELAPSQLSIVTPEPIDFVDPDDVVTFTYSGSGEVEAALVAIDVDSGTSGCEPEDFTTPLDGAIAVIERGTCPFADKATNAVTAGASAVVIFNDGATPERLGPVNGTLGGPFDIPVVGPSNAVGLQLVAAAQAGGTARVATETLNELNVTTNVIAQTTAGDPDNVVMLGSHLDSVPAGPGINDNGSGSATVLEIAIQANRLPRLNNAIRFGFWGAEELGLLGSTAYVDSLDDAGRDQIALNLNFDMVGSPNYARFVYDGNGSAGGGAGPTGSGAIESAFIDYFGSKDLASAPTAFDGRSDYGPFIETGIPAGGLFTGAEGIKTDEEAALFGGEAGVAYDACYHEACDVRENINRVGLGEMSDAAANITGFFSDSTLTVNGVLLRTASAADATGPIEFDRAGDLWIR